jgi:hypothetical protein
LKYAPHLSLPQAISRLFADHDRPSTDSGQTLRIYWTRHPRLLVLSIDPSPAFSEITFDYAYDPPGRILPFSNVIHRYDLQLLSYAHEIKRSMNSDACIGDGISNAMPERRHKLV